MNSTTARKPTRLQRAMRAVDENALHAIACGLSWACNAIPDWNALAGDGLTLETAAGPAFFHYIHAEQFNQARFGCGWLHVRFSDVERAKRTPGIDLARLNPFSGKYNFMELNALGALRCETELAKLAPTTSTSAKAA